MQMCWLFARDGALTANQAGRWWGDNSLPARSAVAMLKDVSGAVAVTCVVAPAHAAQLRALLDRIEPGHAIIVIQPDAAAAHVALHCEDLSDAITAKRLWWAIGSNWADTLDRLLTELPGLPVPGRFVRTPDVADAVAEQIMPVAQEIFSRHMTARSQQIATLRSASRRVGRFVKHVAVVAPSRFRLWSNAGATLARTLATTTPQHMAADWRTVDTDQPTASSPLAVAQAAVDCDAIVMADSGRCDNPNLLPIDLPWITWVTTGRVPRFDQAGPNDRLLLADANWRSVAKANGWPDARMAIAAQPMAARRPAPARPAHLALVVNIPNLDVPDVARDYSSHRLVWDAIREQLSRDPFAIGSDVGQYFDRHLKKANIDPASVDRNAFIDRLIMPAYAIGVASVLLDAQVPLTIYGDGWEDTPCRDHARGPLRSRVAFEMAVDAATALVRPWPVAFAHEIDSLNRPVLTAVGSRAELLAAANALLAGGAMPESSQPTLRAELVLCGVLS